MVAEPHEEFEQVPNEEHERRFLVSDVSALELYDGDRLLQAYLWALGGYAVRVRLTSPHRHTVNVPKTEFTLKGPRVDNMRYELEQDIPVAHAIQIFNLSNFKVSKVRYAYIDQGEMWAIDVFDGANQGLVIAEFEGSVGAVEAIKAPPWAPIEVTGDPRYDNENLAKNPWTTWGLDASPGTTTS